MFRDDENVELSRNFFQAKIPKQGNTIFLVTGFATVSHKALIIVSYRVAMLHHKFMLHLS